MVNKFYRNKLTGKTASFDSSIGDHPLFGKDYEEVGYEEDKVVYEIKLVEDKPAKRKRSEAALTEALLEKDGE